MITSNILEGIRWVLALFLFSIFFQTTLWGQGQESQSKDKLPKIEKRVIKVNWISIDEALELSTRKGNNKKILVDIYTKWCRWCERMDRITFQHPKIAEYINKNFYPVKFDAQYAEEVIFKDKTYGNVKNGKKRYHELAIELLRGKMSYPTVVFLDEKMELIQAIVGFKSPRQFEKIATYFGSDYYRKTPWSAFQKSYKTILTAD